VRPAAWRDSCHDAFADFRGRKCAAGDCRAIADDLTAAIAATEIAAAVLGRTRGPNSPRGEQEPRCTALLGRSAKPEIERIEHAGRRITGIRRPLLTTLAAITIPTEGRSSVSTQQRESLEAAPATASRVDPAQPLPADVTVTAAALGGVRTAKI
jgi:hypothetical protein